MKDWGQEKKGGIRMRYLAVLMICLMLPVVALSQEKVDLKLMTGPMGGRGILSGERSPS